MLHACVERFDVTGTVGKILGTKRGVAWFVFVSQTMHMQGGMIGCFYSFTQTTETSCLVARLKTCCIR